MKKSTTLAAGLLVIAMPAWSQTSAKKTEEKPLPCVDVQIGQDEAPALNCMNDALRRQVEHTQATPAISPPIDARSSSNQIGGFNNQAARQQMGSAFGVSPNPQRPKTVFADPLLPPASH